MARLSAASEAAGSVLFVAAEGTVLTPDERRFLHSKKPAGLTLFKRNLTGGDVQIQELLASIQSVAPRGRPILMAVDQEGGRVSRLAGAPNLGPAQNLFPGVGPESLSRITGYGKELGGYLKTLGIHIDFAPVLDILTNATNHAIGDRVFGLTREEVALRAGAFLRGLQSQGIAGCLKHFPGQGDAQGDTHETSITISLSRGQLLERELYPFKALMKSCPMIMVSHCIYEKLCDKPASLSYTIQTQLLRQSLGFQGLIVSDDMNMGAVPQDLDLWQHSLIEALKAGSDILLVCRDLQKCELAHEALVQMMDKDQTFAALLHEKKRRIDAFRERFIG